MSFFSPDGPHLAPPILAINETVKATLSQTPAILAYLAPLLGLGGTSEIERASINQLTLTALDLATEAHDVRAPV